MTQTAYGIDGLEKSDFNATTDAEAGQLREDAATTAQIRIMDPAIISPTVRAARAVSARTTSSRTRSTSTATRSTAARRTPSSSVRELNVDQLGAAASWQNTTLVYTHGYGLVAAEGNERTTDGNPVFLERGIPATGFLLGQENFEPRVYFGEYSPPYSIVGAPEGHRADRARLPVGRRAARARRRRRSRATAGRASAASSTG